MRYELMVALRYLRSRRKSAFISITTLFTAIGVMIGVAALTITVAVMNGFEANLRSRILSLTPQVQVVRYGAMSNYGEVQAAAEKIAGVTGADPFIVGQGMLTSKTAARGVVVRGIDPANPAAISDLRRYLEQGDVATLKGPPTATAENSGTSPPLAAIAVGTILADKLHLHLGDQVRLISPISVSGGEIKATSAGFRVGAIYLSGVQFIDETVIFMELGRAQAFFGRHHQVDGVQVHLANLDDTWRVTDELRKVFSFPPYRVRNWIEINQAASAGFAMLKRVYSLVLMLLIAVAAFNLVAMLIMVVMEKRKDIAILMTMGATAGAVRLIFIIKGLIVGALGTVAGLALGVVGCFTLAHYHFIHIPREIYGISTLPVAASPAAFGWVGLAAMFLCLIAALYPARQASKQLPVEVIRWE
jgi:lipoprotein-releasing system permease protein